MLRDFLSDNRDELIERCRVKVASRRAPRVTPAELSHGVPLFLAQLTERFAQFACAPGQQPAPPGKGGDIEQTADRHGRELLAHDFTIEQVVHDYGDVCQSITELAMERAVGIPANDFGCLNITLDNAIASAVASFTLQQKTAIAGDAELAAGARLGLLANEMRNLLNTAILATSAMRRGSVGFGGSTAAALDRSLIGLRALIDRTLLEVRLEADIAHAPEVIEVGPFIAAVQLAAALDAKSTGCDLTVVVQPDIFVRGDRHMLAASVANLLHGCLDSAQHEGQVLLTARARGGRVIIDVEDMCGEMAADDLADVLERFDTRAASGSALGSALEFTRKGVEANGGTLSARAVPGKGGLYSIELEQVE